MVAAGTLLASCASKAAAPEATAAPAVVATPTLPPTKIPSGKVVVAHRADEFGDDILKAVKTDLPEITVEAVADDPQKVFAMLAAGTPPDMLRAEGPNIPQYLARKMLKDLTPYFQASQLLKIDDLAPSNKFYWAKSPLEVGAGAIYGMCKDWSPDFTIWVNDEVCKAAGVTLPAADKPMTWAEVYDLAKKTAKFDGDRVVNWGYGYEKGWTDRIIMNALTEKGESLYKDSFSALDWSDDAKSLVQYFFDMAKEKLTTSQVNPSPNGWDCGDFLAGISTMMQYGYWASPMMSDPNNQSSGKCRMLPAPTWSGVHRSPTGVATGDVILAKSENPEAAWRVFEWFMGGPPSVTRASSGWGVPALMSQMKLMPNKTDFDKQVQTVLQAELAVSNTTIQFNPFMGPTSFTTTWDTNFGQALSGAITFEEMLKKVETDVNAQIAEGIDRIQG